MAEEDIDVEAIQAQIDLSMSVASSLVSSWMKPSAKSKTPYNQNLEAELKDYMKRPPRLGVGASIPESTASSSRETARLKGQLVGRGTKRAREDEEGSSKNQQNSDDEGESRAGAIQKKSTVPNPFSMPEIKKKKIQVSVPQPSATGKTASGGKAGSPPTGVSSPAATSPNGSEVRQKKKRKKGNKDSGSQNGAVPAPSDPPSTSRSQQGAKDPDEAFSPNDGVSASPPLPVVPVSPTKHRTQGSNDLANSVLNLNGPVGEDESESDNAASPSKGKKKRKKRKRKKKSHVVQGPEASS